ncbi:hypothetical protein ACWDF1_30900 [Streptomyces coelicoflavus]|uniref:Uncharacterized protein n=1 Tax=Streptomyces coelicoflavus TaxID=285562 RepID=A0A6N9V3S3_9ACTN|nr:MULTISPECIES: hypothetical protein [Streptomyces]EHN71978.1 hypothetical protein SMCF_8604 [Streptomyces coelicoflavus ZG0656]KPC77379.1 hypothetical protein ADL35_20235 [Streptomyces sp. NRRL WC-3753]MZE41623.1 hypothetical protein [Streptomyces sp. SID5477]NEB21962.1 hypothetical protein [Streptomyces coelicoflavus]OWA14804.1 hypothetical protein B9W64_16010 [Streptomyces sp. CS159]
MSIRIEAEVNHPVNDEVERVLGLAAAAGAPVMVTVVRDRGRPLLHGVLVPAATLALWEHWAPTAYPAGDRAEGPEPAHPEQFGPFTLFRRRVGGRTAVVRDGVVVAELIDPAEAHWLEEKARDVRQGFMDPKQKAAFEEFLARQAERGER